MQANHGRPATLRRLARGDLVAFYSPRTTYPAGEKLQRFTAIGRIVDDAPYQVEMMSTFYPWRRRMQFMKCVDAPIHDLLDQLSFIKDAARWGHIFRRGLFEIGEQDFVRIAEAMDVLVSSAFK